MVCLVSLAQVIGFLSYTAATPAYEYCKQVSVKVNFTLEQVTKTLRGSRGIPPLFL